MMQNKSLNLVSNFRKVRSFFHKDWCKKCSFPLEEWKRQLFMLPIIAGHYVSHKEADYYRKNLVKVNSKKDIPVGYYACGIYVYHCSFCGNKRVKLSIFLPVRGEEKLEEVLYFEEGELDSFLERV